MQLKMPPTDEIIAAIEADKKAEAQQAEMDLSGLLNKISRFFYSYIVFKNKSQCHAVTLWTASTYKYSDFEQAPYLHIKSPEFRSGKTRLMETLELLVFNPWRVISVSEAVLFRKIEQDNPTLLLDEIDTVFKNKDKSYEALRALLNAGNRQGVKVPRCQGEGKNIKLKDFDVFCPKALAGIGDLQRNASTVADRSIAIELARKKPNEAVKKFRYKEAIAETEPLRRSLKDWAVSADLSSSQPVIPDALDDRAADNWEALLAIAEAAGGNWLERAKKAAVILSGKRDEASLGMQLLADLKNIFEDKERLKTEDILKKLIEMEESPWGEYYHGKPLTAHGLAKLLKPYEIKPATHRFDDCTAKGYLKADFADAFARYTQIPKNSRNSVTPQVNGAKTANCKNLPNEQNKQSELQCNGVTPKQGDMGVTEVKETLIKEFGAEEVPEGAF